MVMYYSDHTLQGVAHQLERALENLDTLLRDLGLAISPAKSSYCFYSLNSLTNVKGLIRRHHIQISLRGTSLTLAWQTRYLGLYIDYALTWKTHAQEIRKRATARLNVLKALSGIRWGSHPVILLVVCKGFIRSLLDWACQITQPLQQRSHDMLSRIQYASIRTIFGLMRTTLTIGSSG